MKSVILTSKSPSLSSKHVIRHTFLLLNFILFVSETKELTSIPKSSNEAHEYHNGESVDLKRIQQLLDLTSDSVDSLNLENIFQNDIRVKLNNNKNNNNNNGGNSESKIILRDESERPIQTRVKSNLPHTHTVAINYNIDDDDSDSDSVESVHIIGNLPSPKTNSDPDKLSHYNFRDKDEINFNYEKQHKQELKLDMDQPSLKFKKPHVHKKLKVPEGSSLSLAVQLSRPNILPGLFFQNEGIILDAVVEVPVWFDIDVFAKAVYERPKPPSPPPSDKPLFPAPPLGILGKPPLPNEIPVPHLPPAAEARLLGYERCYLYTQLEIIAARSMEVTQSVSHDCLLRTICEIHSVVSFRPKYQNASIIFELIRLFLSPSFGVEDECYKPYIQAERIGRKKSLCYDYVRKCPISFATVIMTNFVPFFSHT